MKTPCIAVALSALLPAAAAAQTPRDSVNLQVTFTGAREMLLQDANKQSVWPEARTLSSKLPDFTYRLLPKRVNVAPEYEPVGPTRLKVDPPLPLLYGGWVEARMGTLFTPVLDAGYTSRRSRKGMWGVQATHRSTQFGFTDVDSVDSRFATTGLEAWGRAFRGNHVWDAEADAGRDALSYYGIAGVRSSGEAFALPASDRSVYLRTGGALGWHYTPSDSAALRPEARLSYRLLSSADAVRTHTWHGTLGASARINGHDASLLGGVLIDRRSFADTSLARREQALLSLQPTLSRVTPTWSANAGLGIYIDARGDQVFHVYPRLEARVPLFRGRLTPFAKWGGDVEMNRLEALLVDVPFVDPQLELRSTYRTVDAAAGIQGGFAGTVRYSAEVGWVRETNHLYFRNDTLAGAGERLGAFYDTLSIQRIGGSLAWKPAMPLEVRTGATLFRYRTSGQLHAWNLPDMAVTAEVRYRFKDVLHVAVEGRIETGRFGLSSVAVPEGVLDNSDAADGYVVDLGTVADFDVHFTYIVTGRLSASLDFKNVLASRYRTFAAYPVQGFQAFLGATYTF